MSETFSCRVESEGAQGWRLPISEVTHLRLLGGADAEKLQALIEANRVRLACWLPWAAGQTLDDTVKFIRESEAQVIGNRGFQTAVICEDKIVGVIGFVDVNWLHRSTTLGYWLDEQQEGRGTMTEAVRVLVDHALAVWELNRVEIRVAAENRRSRAIPERLGFLQEGTLRQAELVNGRCLDCVVYSMLAQDWARRG